jgi:hypothetical protein
VNDGNAFTIFFQTFTVGVHVKGKGSSGADYLEQPVLNNENT